MLKTAFRLSILALAYLSSGCQSKEKQSSKDQPRPNIILIMGDDIGFSDLGCYGSEIQTPNLDMLAENGIRFQTFYNVAKCNPTRSSLLTGLYIGDEKAVNVAQVLGDHGYTTIHTGKEHFDKWVPEHAHAKNAFDHSFYFWAINEFHIPPDSSFYHPFYLGDHKLKIEDIRVKEKPFFKTDVVTDYAISFIDSALYDDKPFFLYLPYHVAHYPLQARSEDIAKYRGKYKELGWDRVRRARYERLQEIGVIDDRYELPPPSSNINKFRGTHKGDSLIRKKIPLYRPWESLTKKEKDDLDLEMAVYAAMIDRMDQNIGKIVQKLKREGLYDNTIIMYLSDNGSSPYDSNRDFVVPPGPADSYRSLGAGWATVSNTPFKYFKQFGHEGGSNTHFIVHWPEKIEPGMITEQPGHIIDIFPTFLEVTEIQYPDSMNGNPTIPLHGKSLLPIFEGKERVEPEFFISGFTDHFRMYREGDWKIVRANAEEWELYNIKKDPTEMNNLASKKPELLNTLLENYHRNSKKLKMDTYKPLWPMKKIK
jgi:arylsulfatase